MNDLDSLLWYTLSVLSFERDKHKVQASKNPDILQKKKEYALVYSLEKNIYFYASGIQRIQNIKWYKK